jgi:hypothetical protein
MVYALMFDSYQQKVRADQWCVSCSGSLADCEAYDTLTDTFAVWAKSDYTDRIKQEDHPVGGEAGAIYELTPVANFSATLDEIDSRRLTPPPGSPATPIALGTGGFVAGLLLHGRIPNPFAGDDK